MDNKAEVVFVNDLEVSGFVNGVVNMAFSTLQFVPDTQVVDDEVKLVIEPMPVITANLRFDLRLAQIMRDRLDQIIEENTKPKVSN
jgi:hypothetical protein